MTLRTHLLVYLGIFTCIRNKVCGVNTANLIRWLRLAGCSGINTAAAAAAVAVRLLSKVLHLDLHVAIVRILANMANSYFHK